MKVNIIIPVHNQHNLLKLCIDSIYKKTKKDFYITVVNDGSDNVTTTYCEELLNVGKIHKLINNFVATGFTNSCNEGIIYSPPCDYCCFLNSDTIIVTDNWLEKVILVGENNYGTGCIGVLSNNATMQSVGKKYLEYNEIEEYGNWIVSMSDNLFPETTFINGFCFFIKSDIIEQVGLLDYDVFPHYGSEDDYILRIREKGYKLIIADNVYVYHYSNQSYKNKRNDIVKISFNNLLNKWGSDKIKKDSIFSEKVLDYLRLKIKNIDFKLKKKLVLGITTYNRLDYLKCCIESWDKSRDKNHEWTLIVADDGSIDGTVEYLLNLNIDNVKKHLIFNNRMGVHYQTNQILKYCSMLDFEYGFKVDDDVLFLKKDWDNKYIEAIIKSGYEHLCFYDYAWGSKYRKVNHILVEDKNKLLRSFIRKKDAQGAFWTFTHNIIEKVGYFDIDNFGFCGIGHVDYTCRCARAGFNDINNIFDLINSNEYIKLPRESYKPAVENKVRFSFNSKEILKEKKKKIEEERIFIPYKGNEELLAEIKIKAKYFSEPTNTITTNNSTKINDPIIDTKINDPINIKVNNSLNIKLSNNPKTKRYKVVSNIVDNCSRTIGYWLRNINKKDKHYLMKLIEERGWHVSRKITWVEIKALLGKMDL